MPTASDPASPSIHKLLDKRVNCWSILLPITASNYLKLVEQSYANRGGIRHQRDALKTTSARRIRARLVEDLRRGAVIPPIVLGLVAKGSDRKRIEDANSISDVLSILDDYVSSLSIIDGMQRTTALLEARDTEFGTSITDVRLEIWVSDNADSLIYRMLVLNTGQVPWNLKHQLSVVYEPLIESIKEKVSFKRFLQKQERRWNGGEFSADSLIEGYIAFGLRRTEVDTQESLADEFSRLDMAEALTTKKYDKYFYPVIQLMVDLDVSVSEFNSAIDESDKSDAEQNSGDGQRKGGREYIRGRNILDGQPARIGFIVAAAVAILGRLGMDKNESDSEARLKELQDACQELIRTLKTMNPSEFEKFLALDVLSEKLSKRPTSAVGRWERTFFEGAFKVLLDENFKVPSLETCWRA